MYSHYINALNNLTFLFSKFQQQNEQRRGEELRDQPFDEHVTSDDHQMIQSSTSKRSSTQLNWLLFATAIDRIAFIIYCLVFTILAIYYSV